MNLHFTKFKLSGYDALLDLKHALGQKEVVSEGRANIKPVKVTVTCVTSQRADYLKLCK